MRVPLGNKKAIFVVNINDYMPDVTSLTMPTVERYADRIGASVCVIANRANEGVSITYEKTQIYDLGKDNDWNIVVDADIAISRFLPDVTMVIPPAMIGVHMAYKADRFFPHDDYFLRDGRNIAIASDFMVASSWCHEIWEPLPGNPSCYEIKRPFILDEYCFSRNLARYGLKFAGCIPEESMIFHLNASSEKVKTMDMLKAYVRSCC